MDPVGFTSTGEVLSRPLLLLLGVRRILFVVGELYLPHQKVEALASCTPNNTACVHNSVYQMYLSRTTAPATCHGFLDLNKKKF